LVIQRLHFRAADIDGSGARVSPRADNFVAEGRRPRNVLGRDKRLKLVAAEEIVSLGAEEALGRANGSDGGSLGRLPTLDRHAERAVIDAGSGGLGSRRGCGDVDERREQRTEHDGEQKGEACENGRHGKPPHTDANIPTRTNRLANIGLGVRFGIHGSVGLLSI
ncbi:MAG: hypothetical protein RI947_1253, partial [Candidatus Parcubacteria bacterium]